MNKTNASANPVNVLSNIPDVLTSVNLLNSNSNNANNSDLLDFSYERFNDHDQQTPTKTPSPPTKTPLKHNKIDTSSTGMIASYVISILLGVAYFMGVALAPTKIFSDNVFTLLMIAIGILNIILFAMVISDSSTINEQMKKGHCGKRKYSPVNTNETNFLILSIIIQLSICTIIAVYNWTDTGTDKAHEVLDILIYIASTFIAIGILLSGGIYIKGHICGIIDGIRGHAYMAIIILAMMINSINYIIFSGKNIITFESYKLITLICLIIAIFIIILTITYWGSISDEDEQKKINKNVTIVGSISMLALIVGIVIYLLKFYKSS
uniref:Uncharacterized protein n=1 Tax=viral metagenome TaxID=1070528 RepID=A0A6C0E8L2_9ZZZZ